MTPLFWKRTVDILMIGLFIVLMGCSMTGDFIHECLGIVLFVLFISHHVLNGTWYRTFMKRRRSVRQLIRTLMTAILLVVVIFMAASSILVSRTLFAFIDYDGGLFARQFHQMTAHLGLILAAIHFGIYGKNFFSWKKFETMGRIQKAKRLIFTVLIVVSCFYGILASFRHDLFEKLLMRQAYSFWNGSYIVFFVDYAAIFVLYATMAHVTDRLFIKHGKTQIK